MQVSKTYQAVSVSRVRELAVITAPVRFAAMVPGYAVRNGLQLKGGENGLQTPNQAAASPKMKSTVPGRESEWIG